MNDVPHIGATLKQRAILRRHLEREHEAEKERFEQIHAQLQVDELMSRFQPEPCQFCAPDDADEIAAARKEWFIAMIVLAFGAPAVWKFADWILPIAWSWK